jgi:diguanylate cyclase (GGDEF)-like protein
MAGLSPRRVTAVAALAVAMIAAAVFMAARIERDTAIHASQQAEASQRLLTAMLDQETGARGYYETRQTRFLAPWLLGTSNFVSALATSRKLDGSDQTLLGSLSEQDQLSTSWHAAEAAEIDRLRVTGRTPTITQALAGKATMDQFRSANALYDSQLSQRSDSSLTLASWLAAGLVAALTVALVLVAVLVTRRILARQADVAARQRELRELLQVSASEEESQRLLISHVERVVRGAGAAVLSRNNSDDRLEPVVSDDAERTPLRMIDADQQRPRSCLAVRLSRSFESRSDEPPLVACEVCGKISGDVVCEPLLVGGQVIGSVLVAHSRKIDRGQRDEVREAVVQCAPILANQRNLALAELRAASDALTGLPNRRSADETIKRMVAQAVRSARPLGVVLLDLDRFKQINDLHGHDQGDKALAAIARTLTATLRASDFAARYGGEEFLILLPETDRAGATEVAQKLCRAIEATQLSTLGSITGSLGVACLPEDAVEPEHLIRKADRALYLAKSRGRNRVEVTESGDPEWLQDGDWASSSTDVPANPRAQDPGAKR